jgi:hypothetical protein
MCPGNAVFQQIGKFSELCKATGYKASTINQLSLITIFAAFWADTLYILKELVTHIDKPEKIKEVTKNFIPTLQTRLVWLTQQILNFTKEFP